MPESVSLRREIPAAEISRQSLLPPGKFRAILTAQGRSSQHELLHYIAWSDQDGPRLLAVTGNQKLGSCQWLETVPAGGRWESLAGVWPVVLWPEREIHDQVGQIPLGHPDLRPLLRPDQVRLQGVAHGSGSFHMPLGPVRGDVSESLLFYFDLLGEQIMFMESQLFYKRRGIEALAADQEPAYVLLLAERVAGTSGVAHATALARAVEQALAQSVAVRVEMERVLLGELERLYNHAHDLAQLAGATGMTVGQAQLARVKEELLRLNGDLCGSRFLRRTVRIGASSGIDWNQNLAGILKLLQSVAQRFDRFTRLLQKTPTFIDRLKGTGVVKQSWATAYDVVGPVARSAGLARDVRRDYLSPALDLGSWSMVVDEENKGDAFSRFTVRVGEWWQSWHLLNDGLPKLARPDWGQDLIKPAGARHEPCWGLGLAESPRGRTVHLVKLAENGQIALWRVRAASACNWPVFGLATANGNIQTDFPIIEASFALCVASTDR